MVAAAVVAAAAAAAVVAAAAAAVLEVEMVAAVQSEHVAAAVAAVRSMEPADAAGLAVSSAGNGENESLEYPRGCFRGKVCSLLETHAQ